MAHHTAEVDPEEASSQHVEQVVLRSSCRGEREPPGKVADLM